MPSSWQPGGRRIRVVTLGTALVVLAGAGTAWGLTRGSAASYRSAVAANTTVMQTLSVTGTVSPVSHADESFQVAGTVADIAVKQGQHVRAGQLLGRLDRTELRSALRSARSTLAAARNRMTGDESGQGSSSPSSPTIQAAQPTVVLTPPPSTSGSLGGEQAAVRSAQQATDEDLAHAAAALKAADDACASSATTPTSSSTTPDPGATSSPDPTTTSGGSTADVCTTAGAALLAAQEQVDRDEQQVETAEAALTKTLSALSQQASKSSRSSTGSQHPRSHSQTLGATAASAADIALDQASIDQALSAVDSDRASLDQATLRAAISGRVAAVTVSRGDQVSASSSSPAFVLVGSRQEQTTVDLSAAEIRDVKVGMAADVVADGSSRHLSGHVVSVDAAGITASDGTVTFPVTISLPSGTNVVSGAAASVTLVIASVDDVLAVPTSAVHYSGATTYVELLRDGKESHRTVKIGAVGAAYTEVTSGLAAGDRVVLADLNAAVPSSSSSLTGLTGGGGRGGAFVRRFLGGAAAPSGGTLTFGGPAG